MPCLLQKGCRWPCRFFDCLVRLTRFIPRFGTYRFNRVCVWGGGETVRGKRTYGGRPGQHVEEQGTWAAQKHSEAGYGRPVDRGVWTAKTVKRPRQQPAHPQCANYWAPLTRKRHTMSHSAQSQHTNYWASRTWKRHQQEHRPQRSTESSDPTQQAKGRAGDCPGPRKQTTTRRNVTQGGGGGGCHKGWVSGLVSGCTHWFGVSGGNGPGGLSTDRVETYMWWARVGQVSLAGSASLP